VYWIGSSGSGSSTNLGAVHFPKRLEDFEGLSRKAPRVIVYEGTSKLGTRLDKVGVKGYAVGFEGFIDLINSQVPTNEIIEKALRRQVKMFPEIAIRELAANALIHQDFNETGTSVVVEIYSDRLEVSSPGRPFIAPDRFIDEYQSRNERLADLMRRLGICEEKGSGIDKVVSSAEVYQLPAPDFRVGERHTTAVLFGHKPFEAMDRSDRVRACYQHCCLRYVMNEKMSNQSLRERFKLAEQRTETVSRILRDTSRAGLIKLDQPDRASKRYARYVPYWA
jgi:ATP-dependent DNA helicase RecG